MLPFYYTQLRLWHCSASNWDPWVSLLCLEILFYRCFHLFYSENWPILLPTKVISRWTLLSKKTDWTGSTDQSLISILCENKCFTPSISALKQRDPLWLFFQWLKAKNKKGKKSCKFYQTKGRISWLCAFHLNVVNNTISNSLTKGGVKNHWVDLPASVQT